MTVLYYYFEVNDSSTKFSSQRFVHKNNAFSSHSQSHVIVAQGIVVFFSISRVFRCQCLFFDILSAKVNWFVDKLLHSSARNSCSVFIFVKATFSVTFCACKHSLMMLTSSKIIFENSQKLESHIADKKISYESRVLNEDKELQ